MACLLSLFVSQKCSDHDCSISEKFNTNSIHDRLVLTFNFISLLFFIFVYNLEFNREHFIIRHFNDNPKLGDHHIKTILSDEPNIEKSLNLWNKRFYYGTISAIGLGTINFIVSGHLIIINYYNGMRTITSLVTNILLVANSLSSNYAISKKSFKEGLALSSTRLEPISYNVFEPHIRSAIEARKNDS